MIKNLLNADEDPPPGTKVIIEDTIINPPAEIKNGESTAEEIASAEPEATQVFEDAEDAEFFTKPVETAAETPPTGDAPEMFTNAFAEQENSEPAEVVVENQPSAEQTDAGKTVEMSSGTLFQSEFEPPSTAETVRQSGLAYSAAIVLFGSVVFMMILGWFADLLLGSSPWGIVGGIILGGIIGFIQFFRITSQIFKK